MVPFKDQSKVTMIPVVVAVSPETFFVLFGILVFICYSLLVSLLILLNDPTLLKLCSSGVICNLVTDQTSK